MKRNYLFAALISSAFAFAQSGVGINTSTPTETFDVSGTTRLRELPLQGATSAIKTKPDGSGSTATDQTFTPDRTL